MAMYSNASTPRFNNIAEAAQMLYRDGVQAQDVVNEMISTGYSINAQDMDGNTALHWAAWFKLDALVQRLLERGARADIGNSSKETAVHWAAKSSNTHALNLATKNERGLLSQRDVDGFTPFLIAAQNDNAPILEWMYLKGVSVEEQDDWGRTGLQWACYKGHRKTVQWLLSRQADIAHRDHEGMTAIHWAALKGHEQIADMLIDVGAVYLLTYADAAGDTPITLAHRKKNRYLVCSFHKARFLFWLIGRPYISRNHFANLYLCFSIYNLVVFLFILAPNIWATNPRVVVSWISGMALSLTIWVNACLANPGWMSNKTIVPQHSRIERDPSRGFDASQPVESQMVNVLDDPSLDDEEEGVEQSELARLESEQAKYNYQRQLITEARRRLDHGSACCGVPVAGTGGTDPIELQPLMNYSTDQSSAQQAQLQRASFHLGEKAKANGELLGRERTEHLLNYGCGEYVTAVERGEFKQVCVVCRTKREMRSHHCKECGRCVHRLDHHCPWIDNCVGLGNQRMFYCFIVSLFCTILGFYYAVWVYAVNAVLPVLIGDDDAHLWSAMSWRFGPELSQLVVLATLAFNLIWMLFVGALVLRHTVYMMVNVTTYEVLVRPPHVVRRFPKNSNRFWFISDFSPFKAIRNCFAYWTLDTEHDPGDFLVQPNLPADSFVVTSEDFGNEQGDSGGSAAPSGSSKGQYLLLPSNGMKKVAGP